MFFLELNFFSFIYRIEETYPIEEPFQTMSEGIVRMLFQLIVFLL